MQRSKSACHRLLAQALVTLAAAALISSSGAQTAQNPFLIETLSTRPDIVTGGDVLVRVTYNPVGQVGPLWITLNEHDATGSFRAGIIPNTMVGLVRGLELGANTLRVRGKVLGGGIRDSSLQLTNYDIRGPVISGPHETPFICATASFTLPVTGGNLGQPLDSDCSIATRVDYVYWSTASTYKPLNPAGAMPSDVA